MTTPSGSRERGGGSAPRLGLQLRDRHRHDVPPPGTKLLGLDIHGGVATVDLSAEFASGGGSLSMGLRRSPRWSSLARPVATPSTRCRSFSMAPRLPTEGHRRRGRARRRPRPAMTSPISPPLVLVESPVPGELVRSPLTIEGIAKHLRGDGAATTLTECRTGRSSPRASPPPQPEAASGATFSATVDCANDPEPIDGDARRLPAGRPDRRAR